jgi:hypothetical protein
MGKQIIIIEKFFAGRIIDAAVQLSAPDAP